ncbi:hypothetical protein BGZ73_004893 [Actinomortierella ambigua]|nr:hypothetical protein BGZ73_004893 [Actinomortierella ambigua]
MSKLVPIQIVIIILTIVSIVLSVLYHLSVAATRLFPAEEEPIVGPTRDTPPDPSPPLLTPFGIISLVALFLTLVLHCAQADYLEPRGREEDITAEEAAVVSHAEQQQQHVRAVQPTGAPSSPSSSTSTSPVSIISAPQRPSKTKRLYRYCFVDRSTFISYPRPPLPKAIAEATPYANATRFASAWYMVRALPWMVLLVLWVAISVGWFIFLYSPRHKTYMRIVAAGGWMGWFQVFNTTKLSEERWVGPAQCKSLALSCHFLLAQAIIAVLLVVLLVAEMVILYVGQKKLAEAEPSSMSSLVCQTREQEEQKEHDQQERHQRQQLSGAHPPRPNQLKIRHPRGGSSRKVAVKPLPPVPDALTPPLVILPAIEPHTSTATIVHGGTQ